MTEKFIKTSTGRQVYFEEVTPDAQASTASAVVITGSEIDMRAWRSLSITLKNITNTITYWIYGANISDFTDEVVIQTADILAAGIASYAVELAPYAYYRVKIQDKVGGSHGTVTAVAIGKR